jgi:hypothetical protein
MLSSAERLLGVRVPLTPLGCAGAREAPEGMAEGMFGGESAAALRPIILVMLMKMWVKGLDRNAADGG